MKTRDIYVEGKEKLIIFIEGGLVTAVAIEENLKEDFYSKIFKPLFDSRKFYYEYADSRKVLTDSKEDMFSLVWFNESDKQIATIFFNFVENSYENDLLFLSDLRKILSSIVKSSPKILNFEEFKKKFGKATENGEYIIGDKKYKIEDLKVISKKDIIKKQVSSGAEQIYSSIDDLCSVSNKVIKDISKKISEGEMDKKARHFLDNIVTKCASQVKAYNEIKEKYRKMEDEEKSRAVEKSKELYMKEKVDSGRISREFTEVKGKNADNFTKPSRENSSDAWKSFLNSMKINLNEFKEESNKLYASIDKSSEEFKSNIEDIKNGFSEFIDKHLLNSRKYEEKLKDEDSIETNTAKNKKDDPVESEKKEYNTKDETEKDYDAGLAWANFLKNKLDKFLEDAEN